MQCKVQALALSIALVTFLVTSSAKADVPDVMCATVQVCDFDEPDGIDAKFRGGPCAAQYQANCYTSLLAFLRGCADVILSKKPKKPAKITKQRLKRHNKSDDIQISRIK